MLQNKIATLDAALETAKDEISKSFVEGFNRAIKQFKVAQSDVDTSLFNPFKRVVGKSLMRSDI